MFIIDEQCWRASDLKGWTTCKHQEPRMAMWCLTSFHAMWCRRWIWYSLILLKKEDWMYHCHSLCKSLSGLKVQFAGTFKLSHCAHSRYPCLKNHSEQSVLSDISTNASSHSHLWLASHIKNGDSKIFMWIYKADPDRSGKRTQVQKGLPPVIAYM